MLSERAIEMSPLPKLVFAAGAAGRIAEHVRAAGRDHAVVVTDPGVAGAGLLDQVIEHLESAGITTSAFAGVEPNPTTANVVEGSELLAPVADRSAVVALGGGSAMDCAKAMAIHAPNGGGPVTSYGLGCAPEHPAVPLVAVPTTSGTGSETNNTGVITDLETGRKFYVAHASTAPTVAILDPKLTLGLPAYPTATCGMDALTHAIEAYASSNANPIADGIALEAISLVARWLPTAVEDGSDLEARSNLLLAAFMAGASFTLGPLLGICHAMGHPLSARLHAAHGQTLATLLPHVMGFNLEVRAERYARVARTMGAAPEGASDLDAAQAAIKAVATLSERVGTGRSIRDLGGDEDLVPTLVEDALADPVMITTPRWPSAEDVRDLYLAAL